MQPDQDPEVPETPASPAFIHNSPPKVIQPLSAPQPAITPVYVAPPPTPIAVPEPPQVPQPLQPAPAYAVPQVPQSPLTEVSQPPQSPLTNAVPQIPQQPIQPIQPIQPPQTPLPAQPQAQSPPVAAPQAPNPYQVTAQSGSSSYTMPAGSNNAARNKKKMIIAAGSLAAVVLLATGAIFGLYLPNQPQNVYSTGLSRTGKVVDTLVTEATQENKLATITNTELSGSVEVNSPDGTYSGSFNSKYDAEQSDSNFKYDQSDSEGKTGFSLNILTDKPKDKDYGDIFFQLDGLTELGVDEFIPGFSQYDGKWVSISDDYLKSIIPAEEAMPNQDDFTEKDAAELAKIVSSTTREYVFTADKNKAVLEQKSFVGTEKLEGNITANHYVMTLSKENSKKYCRALTERVMASDAYKRIPGVNSKTIDEDKQTALTECEKNADDEIKENEEFDMWIDKKRKLIHKIRISDKEDKGSYFEVGQTYADGDVIPMFIKYHSDKDKIDSKVTLNYDTKKSITKGDLVFEYDGSNNFENTTGDVIRDSNASSEKYSIKASFEFKPFEGDVKIERPTDAVPIEKLLETSGIDPTMFSGLTGETSSSVNNRDQDTERETDLSAIQSQLEAYYSERGMYPSSRDLNSAGWRSTNMAALDDEALIDPDGTDTVLAVTSTATQYGYEPRDCVPDEKDCQAYALTASLSDGTEFIKENLN